MKDMSLVNCVMEQLSFTVDLDDDVQCRKSYHIVASICHSGTLATGHYTAPVLHKQDSQWLLCNDKTVLPINIAMCFFMSCLNYFIVTFSMQGGLILFFSSGVMTLLMTPVT